MKVAFLTRIPPAHCGIAEYSSMLISELMALGLKDILVIGDRDWKNGLPPVYPEPYTGAAVYQCFKSEMPGYTSAVECLERIGKIDLLHIQHEFAIFPDNNEFLELVAASKRYADRIVVTLHTVAHYSQGDYFVEFQRRLATVSDALVVHSSLQEFELWVQGIGLDKVYRIPHGTLVNPYRGAEKADLLNKLGLSRLENKYLLVVPGFLRPDKGLEVALSVISELRRRDRSYLLVLQGERQGVESREYLRRLLGSGLRGEGVFFSEKYLSREEMLMLLAAADAIMLPYNDASYGVSGALHLAMGSGKPVICTRVPKLIECYEKAPQLTVPAGYPELIADLVERIRLGGDESLLAGVKAMLGYAEATSWRSVARMHISLYNAVLGGNPVKKVLESEAKTRG